MKNLKDFSWEVPEVKSDCNRSLQKPKRKYWKIIWYSFLWIFFVFLGLWVFDVYFFYKENKENILNLKTSLTLNIFEITENINDKNYKEIDERVLKIEQRIGETELILEKYKNKFTFKVFWISKLIEKIEKSLKDSVIILKSSVSIIKHYEKLSEKNLKKNHLEEIFKEISVIEKNIISLKSTMWILDLIPFDDDLKNKIEKIDELTGEWLKILKDFRKYESLILQIFWSKSPQTTVFLFQNSNEIRATWWFVWSFLLMNTNNWTIQKWSIYDIYQFDWQITAIEKTPFESESLAWEESWSLRDANSSPDLEISAKNINYLFEKAGWETIDNFIFVNQDILWDVIKIIWNIELKNTDLILDSENYDFLIQYLVESRKDQMISPKLLVINQLKNIIKEKVFQNPKFVLEIYDLKNKVLENKDIQIYSSNWDINDELTSLGIESNFPEKDFIAPIFISISWNKSDKFIKTDFEIEKKWEFEFVLKINRNFEIPESFLKLWNEKLVQKYSDISKVELKRILWFWWNRSVLQLYVPSTVDLLFLEAWNKNFEAKKWTQWDLNVFEIELSEIFDWEKLNLELYFKSDWEYWEIEIFRQSWIN